MNALLALAFDARDCSPEQIGISDRALRQRAVKPLRLCLKLPETFAQCRAPLEVSACGCVVMLLCFAQDLRQAFGSKKLVRKSGDNKPVKDACGAASRSLCDP